MPVFTTVLYQPMVVQVRQTKKASARNRDLVKQAKCPACEKPIPAGARRKRGMCLSCYQAAYRAIAKGLTTEVELMRKGLMNQKTKGGRPPKNDFSKRLAGGKL